MAPYNRHSDNPPLPKFKLPPKPHKQYYKYYVVKGCSGRYMPKAGAFWVDDLTHAKKFSTKYYARYFKPKSATVVKILESVCCIQETHY